MCGIGCVIGLEPGLDLRDLVARMNGVARHRGPDASGVGIIGNVGLGHTRLAIIDLSDGGKQPMQRGDHHISYNGEIYNYVELRRELEGLGHRFVSSSDTEVLLAALEQWGMAALDRLNGMFAFVYLDARARQLYLVRDRFGKKPLVYARSGTMFCAASETKQLLASGSAAPRVDLDVALDFVANGALNRSELTFFAGIKEIRGGHYGRYDLTTNRLEIVRWYDLAGRVKPRRPSYAEARDTVRELLIGSIVRRHRADVRIGACLSGGIDSSAIVSISAGLESLEPLPTITTFAPGKGYDERTYSREVIARFGLPSLEICPDVNQVWKAETLEEIGYFQDQPIPSGSHYNEYCVFRAAREAGLIVMLDGQGADEYFGGYGEFWFAAQMEHARGRRLTLFLEGIAARAEAVGQPRHRVVRSFLSNVSRRRRCGGTRIGPRSVSWLRERKPCADADPLAHTFSELSVLELDRTSLPYQLHSEDRNSMRWSVESRLPFMDHLLVEYVQGLPTEYKVGGGFQKRVLRDAVPELPPAIARRKDKIGFASPDWSGLVHEARHVRDQIGDALAVLGETVDGAAILDSFDDMVRRQDWYDPMFFRLVSLGAWARAFQCRM